MFWPREFRRKERLEKEIRELRAGLDAKQQDLRTKTAAATAAEEQVQRLEQLLREAQVRRARLARLSLCLSSSLRVLCDPDL